MATNNNVNLVDKVLFEIEAVIGLNKSQLAESLGISRQAITKWTSKNKIPKKSMMSINRLHKVSMVYMESGKGELMQTDSNGRLDDKSNPKPILKAHKENKIVKNTIKENIMHIEIEFLLSENEDSHDFEDELDHIKKLFSGKKLLSFELTHKMSYE